jgi:putative flavoprotein involved in K+ transport
MSRVYDTIVVGAGQAGLSAGYHLQRAGMRFAILDGAASPGDAWSRRWDSLRLFTPARYNGLPGMAFPGEPYSLPTKDDVAELSLRLRSSVRAARAAADTREQRAR